MCCGLLGPFGSCAGSIDRLRGDFSPANIRSPPIASFLTSSSRTKAGMGPNGTSHALGNNCNSGMSFSSIISRLNGRLSTFVSFAIQLFRLVLFAVFAVVSNEGAIGAYQAETNLLGVPLDIEREKTRQNFIPKT